MADNNSTVKFKADISQLKSAMQQASRQVKLANSEFKAATAGLDDWSSSAEGLNAKLKQLDSTLKAQKKQVELANEEYEKTVKLYGENSAEADRAKMSLNNYEAAVAKTEKQIDGYTKELEDCENGTGRFAEETEDLDSVVRDVSDGFTVMKGALADLVADGIRAAISAIKDFAKETLTAGMNFEQGMAQVAAVSGASEEELDALTEKAKEMGAVTKFSATESAEAFNYMAMAGWKTEDMLDGIEGIMNLAAASGSDLATTSDIVTDALTAMGYEAKDAGKLADVMAAASSNANTNVEMMGQTFQYAAPIIGALGMNMEDAAVAIGLMANAGIKGEKSGTALRSVLTRLSAPPKECAEAMDELGISLTDSQGNMKSLSTVMQNLREAFSNLGETEQTAYAKAIAGQEAMSGLLAIVNAAPEDYNKLTKAVKESEGAAQSMADTMNDTAQGQLTLLKSQIEGIQIQIYEKLAPALKEAIKMLSEMLNNINWDKVADKIAKFAQSAVKMFINIIEHGEDIVEVLKAIGKVLAVTFVVSKIASFVQTIVGMVTTFKTLKAATDAATTAQKLLNLAQAASPIGIITAGIAGLAAGLLMVAANSHDTIEATNSLTEEQKKEIEVINQMSEAYKELKSTRDESIQGITNEYQYYSELADELETLVGANGKVKEGYEDRANFIITTLNEALGTEITMTDGVIQGYEKIISTIDQVIEKKKAEAILMANQDMYTDAIQNQSKAFKEYAEASNIYNDAVRERNALEEEYNQIANTSVERYAELNGYGHDYEDAAYAQKKALEALKKEQDEANRAVYESKQALHTAEDTYVGYQSTIKNYEGLSSAIISGDSKKISEALNNQLNDFIDAETGTRRSLEQQVKNMETNYKQLAQAVKDGTPGVTEEMVASAQEMVEKANTELAKFEEKAGETGKLTKDEYIKQFGGGKREAEETGKKLGESSTSGVKSGSSGMKKQGTESANNYAKGVENGTSDANKAGSSVGKGAVAGAEVASSGMNDAGAKAGSQFSSGVSSQQSAANAAGASVATSAKSGMESINTSNSGVFFAQGFLNAIDNLKVDAFNKGFALAAQAIQGVKKGQKEGSPSKLTYQSGVYFVQGYINGIASQQKKLQSTVKSMITGVVNQLKNLNNYNFSDVAEAASSGFSETFSQKANYTVSRMQYENEAKIKSFEDEIENLEKKKDDQIESLERTRDNKLKDLERNLEYELEQQKKTLEAKTEMFNKLIQNNPDDKDYYEQWLADYTKAKNERIAEIEVEYKKSVEQTENYYAGQITSVEKKTDDLIATQEKYKEAYQSASSEMISEFSSAMSEYQKKAQDLIDTTINDITDRYNTRYNALLDKQNSLISKLKSAGNLFDISQAGVITVNDINEQTKQIKDYTNKLTQIKKKVSSELFDEIASYDMKEGSAFINQLLSMSAKDLDAYNKAYTEKLKASQTAGEKMYKTDFDQVAKDYKTDINTAFKGLDKQLQDIGTQCMKGFISGLTTNTDYMSKEIKTYVQAMVNTFKKELQIKSPSRVMMSIGDYTGQGFVEGLKDTIGSIKDAAQNMISSVATPLDGFKANIGSLGSRVSPYALPQNNSTVNNYNLVQNNTSPKSLTALETYRARQAQIAMVKAMT